MIWTFNFSHKKEFPELTIFFTALWTPHCYHWSPAISGEEGNKNTSCLLSSKTDIDYLSESSAKNMFYHQRLHQITTTESSQHVTTAWGKEEGKGEKEVARTKTIPCTNLFLV